MNDQTRFSVARVAVVLLGVLPLLYVLSIGPVVLLVGKHDPTVVEYLLSTYYPWVSWLVVNFPATDPWITSYLEFWNALT